MSSSTSSTMKAAVVYESGPPEVLKLEQRPIPKPTAGRVLIRVKAFGLNRSELFTRQGHSPGVKFPRILGIEAVGIVEESPGGEFQKGDVVATCMGGMGRDFDGGYAEYTCVPASQVQVVKAKLSWEQLGALPEMLQTAYGATFKALRVKKGDRFLIRGGTTSVGLAAAAMAKHHGAEVWSTTRKADREEMLKKSGAQRVVIDDGSIAEKVKGMGGVDKVLELVGITTLDDSMKCVNEGGSVCLAGIVGGKWTYDEFNPMASIPTCRNLTTYAGSSAEFLAMPLDELAELIKDGTMHIPIGKVFHLDDIVEAHRVMEQNEAGGKIVVVT